MFIVKQLKRNFTYLLCNYENAPEYVGGSGGGDDGNSTKEIHETIELPSIEEQKTFIKDILENDKIVSLDDNPELKQKILDGLDPTKPEEELNTEQINTVFKELTVIHDVENDILTPDVIRGIEQQAIEEKFNKDRIIIKRIKRISDIVWKREFKPYVIKFHKDLDIPEDSEYIEAKNWLSEQNNKAA